MTSVFRDSERDCEFSFILSQYWPECAVGSNEAGGPMLKSVSAVFCVCWGWGGGGGNYIAPLR